MVPSGRCVQEVAPNGVVEPDLPVFRRRHDVDVERDAGVLELVAHDLADRLVPGPVGVADVDGDLEPFLAGVLQQLLGAVDVAHQRRQCEILRMDRRDVMVLADVAGVREDQRLASTALSTALAIAWRTRLSSNGGLSTCKRQHSVCAVRAAMIWLPSSDWASGICSMPNW